VIAAGHRAVLALSLVVPAGAMLVLLLPGGPGSHAHGTLFGSAPPLAAYCVAWTLMVVAMMWPASHAFLRAVQVVGGDRGLTSATIAYTTAWALVGLAVWAALAATTAWRANLSPGQAARLAAAVLTVAAVYELSPWARSCQRWCARPMAILARTWTRGGAPVHNGLAAGATYGATCIGCCVAMLAVSTAVGISSAIGMLAVTAVMAVQKREGLGERLHVPIAVGLVTLALALLAGWDPSAAHSH
jgi:predicted metal-binding membrane protein